MTTVTDIIFGDPVTPLAKAKQGTLEGKLITAPRADGNIMPPTALENFDERIKVQWSINDRPQKQVRRRVLGNSLLIAIHLDEKEDAKDSASLSAEHI